MITDSDIVQHSDYIYKVAYRFTQDPIDAEDLKQDVILNLLENPHQYHGKSKITTFLYSVIKYRFYYTKRLHANSRTQATNFERFPIVHAHHHRQPRIHRPTRRTTPHCPRRYLKSQGFLQANPDDERIRRTLLR